MIRKAVWAGPRKFYPDSEEDLKLTIESLIDSSQEKVDCKAVLLPHAGYFYSGKVAGKTISKVKIPDTIVVLSPNHTGFGLPYSVMSKGQWEIPLGLINVQEDLADILLKSSMFFKEDEAPHIKEHAIEVELPFLRYFNENISIVPIVVRDFVYNNYITAGQEIAKAIEKYGKETLIVISSDLTHYETNDTAKEKDNQVIDAILKLDEKEMYDKVVAEKISMCGSAPACVGISAAKALGAKQAELIDYKTSGDTSGDYSSVVGYAGIILR